MGIAVAIDFGTKFFIMTRLHTDTIRKRLTGAACSITEPALFIVPQPEVPINNSEPLPWGIHSCVLRKPDTFVRLR